MTAPGWARVDAYLAATLAGADPVLDDVLAASAAAGLPPWEVGPLQGRLLMLLCRIAGARRVLEIGTLGGYSTIWLARGLPPGGTVVTLEADPAYARVARANLHRAGVSDRVEVVEGPAAETLPGLAGPFDFVFVDADKPNHPRYLDWALRLSRPGTVIVGDNVVRDGAVTDPASGDERVDGVRRFLALLGDDPRVDATAIQTVGAKGWDGFAIGVVR